ncbi:uncharacterized protein PAC_06823 [Phialocephala subalpina]|uniref:Uncharacterized protein n=1 Tax=Phialocephala subalpina TaxID=576137 RepID=A0A1L7WVZ7_9HELO|nr:uncharacterized protein PAC_06823 [Phialocephala subalpina]
MCFRCPRSRSPPPRLLSQGEANEEQLPRYSFLRPLGHKIVKNPQIYPRRAVISPKVRAALEALASLEPDAPAYVSRVPARISAKPFREPEERKARELDLDRKSAIPQHSVGQNPKYKKQMARRRYQRPWTMKEWRYVEKISRDVTEEEMRWMGTNGRTDEGVGQNPKYKKQMARRRYQRPWTMKEWSGWEPTEGQMRGVDRAAGSVPWTSIEHSVGNNSVLVAVEQS